MSKTHNSKHETNGFTKKDMLLGSAAAILTAAALGGTAKGRDIVGNAYHPHTQPTKSQEHKATVTTVQEAISQISTAAVGYKVMPGDTEFSIAGKLMPDKDPRDVAYEIIDPQLPEADRANHIVRPGEILKFNDR